MLITILAILFLLVCLFMMLVILIQKPRGGGLSGAFGGGGGSAQSAFGSKTGEFLTWFTVGLFVCFLILAISLQLAIKSESELPSLPPADTTTNTAPAETPVTPAPEENTPSQNPAQ